MFRFIRLARHYNERRILYFSLSLSLFSSLSLLFFKVGRKVWVFRAGGAEEKRGRKKIVFSFFSIL